MHRYEKKIMPDRKQKIRSGRIVHAPIRKKYHTWPETEDQARPATEDQDQYI